MNVGVLSHAQLDFRDTAVLGVDLLLFKWPVTLYRVLGLEEWTGDSIREVQLDACEREVPAKLPLVAHLGQLHLVIVIELRQVLEQGPLVLALQS